jgi:phenol 2-monooxygenase
LFRLYIEIDKLDAGERVSNRNITSDDLIAAARRIFNPYKLDVKQVPWWSVYEIGQRLCDKFDDVHAEHPGRLPRVFIAGDACHTHSPKAGQGMNVSMQDGFNLGWKLAAVLRKQSPSALLHTYSAERQAIAKELIEFDREWAEVLSSAAKSPATTDGEGFDPAATQSYFVRHGRYTAGTAAHYRPSILTGAATYQHLAAGLTIGMRLHSAPVIRIADGKPIHLGHTVKADGRWRIFAFAGAEDPAAPHSGIGRLCQFLADDDQSPVRRFTRAGEDIDSVIDVRAIFQQSHHDLALEALPSLVLPAKGRFGLRDYEKMFSADLRSGQDIFTRQDIFTLRGIDRERGCMLVVRPDQYVAYVLPLDGFAPLAAFFDGFMLQGR